MIASTLFSSLLALAGAVTALPATIPEALAPRDNNAGCNNRSLDFFWVVQDFQYNASYTFSTPAHQIDSGEVAFTLVNPALAYTAACTASSSQLQDYFYGNIIYTCTNGLPDRSAVTTFSYSATAQYLTFNQSWTCSDTTPEYPATYHAYGAVNLTVDRWESTYQNGNWSMGQIYSTDLVQYKTTSDPTVLPYEMTAVA